MQSPLEIRSEDWLAIKMLRTMLGDDPLRVGGIEESAPHRDILERIRTVVDRHFNECGIVTYKYVEAAINAPSQTTLGLKMMYIIRM